MRDMAATSSPKILRKLARLALAKPEHQARLLPILRRQAAEVLPDKALLRIELRRLASSTQNPALARRIRIALDDRAARFEEGKSVDVPKFFREHGNEDAAKQWEENIETYGDKFKKD